MAEEEEIGILQFVPEMVDLVAVEVEDTLVIMVPMLDLELLGLVELVDYLMVCLDQIQLLQVVVMELDQPEEVVAVTVKIMFMFGLDQLVVVVQVVPVLLSLHILPK